MALFGLAACALLSYMVYSIGPDNLWLDTAGSFVCFCSTIVPMVAIRHKDTRIGTNIRVFSGLFLAIFLITNLLFAWLNAGEALYIVVNGLLLLITWGGLYRLNTVRTA